MRKPRIEHLSIYLLKDRIGTAADAVRPGAEYEEIALPDGTPEGMSLFVPPTRSHEPRWLKFIPETTRETLEGICTASAGAVIFVRSRSRLFAVCFGTGWHLLRKDAFERSFGLRAALSLVIPDTLKSVDISTYENFAKYRKISTSKGTTIQSFDIEGQLDLLRGVIGDCNRPLVADQIGGKDPCVLWTRLNWDQLPALCGVLLKGYKSKRVERAFPVLNNITLVRDPSEVERLNAILDNVIATNATRLISVAPPEVVNWDEVSSFHIEHSNAPEASLDLQFADIQTSVGASPVTTADLRCLKITTSRPDGMPGPQHWSAYDCIVTEVSDPQDNDVRLILMAGDWYTVSASFVNEVEQSIQAISAYAGRVLPNAAPGQKENEYNTAFAGGDPSVLQCLDAQTISYGGGRSKIEVCDVLSSGRQLYHIKDYHGSSTLSHLWSQGTVASRLLLEADFRGEVRRKFPGIVQQVIPQETFDAGQFEVVYGIICEPTRQIPADLPFFSKVRLRESVRELCRMGFSKVTVARIIRN